MYSKEHPIKNTLNLLRHFNKNIKIKFIFLTLLIIINTLTEFISIGAIIPFLLALTNPNNLLNNKYLSLILNYTGLNIASDNNILIIFAILFILITLLSSLLKLITLRFTCKFSAYFSTFLASKAYKNYINQPYKYHLKNYSNNFVNVLVNEMIRATTSIECLLLLISSTFLSLLILFSLLIVNTQVTIITLLLISFVYILILKNIQNKLQIKSKVITETNSEIIKLLQESIGGIRETIIDNNQKYLSNLHINIDEKLRQQLEIIKFYKKSPKYSIEAFGLILLSLITLIVVLMQKNQEVIPLIGFIAFAFQKLLTSTQQLYSSWTALFALNSSVKSVLELLNLRKKDKIFSNVEPLNFNNKIVLKNIFFKYQNDPKIILNNLNLTIRKGERIGIIGETGSGKSTLLDILNGLIQPNSGNYYVDGMNLYEGDLERNIKSLQKNIAHVPQRIFLSNDSILNNIAFGIESKSINKEKAYLSAKKALISEDIEKMEKGFNSFVGERGANLSGGQLQRLGIARAIYKEKNILILDESTSSLDIKTENKIINVLDKFSKDLTIIIVAHRFTILENCDSVYELRKGKLFKKSLKK